MVKSLKYQNPNTVDSAYLQVVFVRENIAIKQSARLPESSIIDQIRILIWSRQISNLPRQIPDLLRF